MLRLTRLTGLAALTAALWACGDGGITFPSIDADIIQEACIRGEVPVEGTVSRSGNVTDDDCTEGFDDGYWEGWRVRVSEERTYTIEVTSNFDSWLTVWRVNDVNNIDDNTVDEIAEDDDGGEGVDAMVTLTLRPDVEYVVFVSGYDQSHTGSYTVEFR
jgi:hypothetical protein